MFKISLVFLACCFMVVLLCHNTHSQDSWYQPDGDGQRSRSSVSHSVNNDVSYFKIVKIGEYSKVLPHSLAMHWKSEKLNGIFIDDNLEQSMVIFYGRGDMEQGVTIPRMVEELVDVPPLIDDNLCYYSVRRNKTDGDYFVLKS